MVIHRAGTIVRSYDRNPLGCPSPAVPCRTVPAPGRAARYAVTGCPPDAVVTSRTHGVLASTRLLFCTSQLP